MILVDTSIWIDPEGSRQSLNAFVVDRLSEVAQAASVADYTLSSSSD